MVRKIDPIGSARSDPIKLRSDRIGDLHGRQPEATSTCDHLRLLAGDSDPIGLLNIIRIRNSNSTNHNNTNRFVVVNMRTSHQGALSELLLRSDRTMGLWIRSVIPQPQQTRIMSHRMRYIRDNVTNATTQFE